MEFKKKVISILIAANLFGSVFPVCAAKEEISTATKENRDNTEVEEVKEFLGIKAEDVKKNFDEFKESFEKEEFFKKLKKEFDIKIYRVVPTTYHESTDLPIISFKHRKTGLCGVLSFFEKDKNYDKVYGNVPNRWFFNNFGDAKDFALKHAIEHVVYRALDSKTETEGDVDLEFDGFLNTNGITDTDGITFTFDVKKDRNFKYLENFANILKTEIDPAESKNYKDILKSDVSGSEILDGQKFKLSRTYYESKKRETDEKSQEKDRAYSLNPIFMKQYFGKDTGIHRHNIKVSDLEKARKEYLHPSRSFLYYTIPKDVESLKKFFEIIKNYCDGYEKKEFTRESKISREERLNIIKANYPKARLNTPYIRVTLDDGEFGPYVFTADKYDEKAKKSYDIQCKYSGVSFIDLAQILPNLNLDSAKRDFINYLNSHLYGLFNNRESSKKLREELSGWSEFYFYRNYHTLRFGEDLPYVITFKGNGPEGFTEEGVKRNIKKILEFIASEGSKIKEGNLDGNLFGKKTKKGNLKKHPKLNPRIMLNFYPNNRKEYLKRRKDEIGLDFLFYNNILESYKLYGEPLSKNYFNIDEEKKEINFSKNIYKKNVKDNISLFSSIKFPEGKNNNGWIHTLVAERKNPYNPLKERELEKQFAELSDKNIIESEARLPIKYNDESKINKYVEAVSRIVLSRFLFNAIDMAGRSYSIDFEITNFKDPLDFLKESEESTEHIKAYFKSGKFKEELNKFLKGSIKFGGKTCSFSKNGYYKATIKQIKKELERSLESVKEKKEEVKNFLKQFEKLEKENKIDLKNKEFEDVYYSVDPYLYLTLDNILDTEFKKTYMEFKKNSDKYDEKDRDLRKSINKKDKDKADNKEDEKLVNKKLIYLKKDFIVDHYSKLLEDAESYYKKCIKNFENMVTEKAVKKVLTNIEVVDWEKSQEDLRKKLKDGSSRRNFRRGCCRCGRRH